jgi:chromosome segregation protein
LEQEKTGLETNNTTNQTIWQLQISELEKKLTETETKLANAQEKLKSEREIHSDRHHQYQATMGQLAGKDKIIVKLKNELVASEVAKESLASQLTKTQENLVEEERKNQEQTDKFARLIIEKSDLENQINELTKKIGELTRQIENLEIELNLQTNEKNRAQEAEKALKNQVGELNKEVERLNQVITQLKSIQRKLEYGLSEATNKHHITQKALSLVRQKIAELETAKQN